MRPGAATTTSKAKEHRGAQGRGALPRSPPHPPDTSSTGPQPPNWLLSPFPPALFSTHSSPSRETLSGSPWQLGATICLPHSVRIPSLSRLPTREKSQRNPESGQDREQPEDTATERLQGHLGGGGMDGNTEGMVRQRLRDWDSCCLVPHQEQCGYSCGDRLSAVKGELS